MAPHARVRLVLVATLRSRADLARFQEDSARASAAVDMQRWPAEVDIVSELVRGAPQKRGKTGQSKSVREQVGARVYAGRVRVR